ncbi:MAG TPA: alpha/beta fold hydrolase, partial [Polyangiaceae bacterium]
MRLLLGATLAVAGVWAGACSSSNGGSTTDAGTSDGGTSDGDTTDGDTTDGGGEASVDTIDWQPCGSGSSECATVTVPVDYEAPADGNATLEIVRVPAGDPSQRVGVVFMNFGGPGVATVAQLSGADGSFPLLAGSADDTLRQRFDIIGIDWRGVGQSSPETKCYTPAIEQAVLAAPVDPTSDPTWAQLFAATNQIQAGCQATNDAKQMAHLDTATFAHDMDTVRSMMGEDKINYLGFSYGTYLGEMY